MELTLVVRSESKVKDKDWTWDTQSIDVVAADNLTSLLGQFLIVLSSVHRRIVNDIKTELRIIDDDVPF